MGNRIVNFFNALVNETTSKVCKQILNGNVIIILLFSYIPQILPEHSTKASSPIFKEYNVLNSTLNFQFKIATKFKFQYGNCLTMKLGLFQFKHFILAALVLVFSHFSMYVPKIVNSFGVLLS